MKTSVALPVSRHAFERQIAQARREARTRALQELEALMRGAEIEGGVGADVERIYYLLKVTAVAAWERAHRK